MRPSLKNSSLLYDLYGGMRGSFSSDMGFDVRMSKSRGGQHAALREQPPISPSAIAWPWCTTGWTYWT